MAINEIIYNHIIEITPKNIYKLIIIFGIICFISGIVTGYTINTYIIYNKLYELINNHGILIFDDKYYRFVEIYLN